VIGMIAARLGRDVHRRSLERALAPQKKIACPFLAAAGDEVIKGLRAAARRSAWRRTDPGADWAPCDVKA